MEAGEVLVLEINGFVVTARLTTYMIKYVILDGTSEYEQAKIPKRCRLPVSV